jgi:hypothetical protein
MLTQFKLKRVLESCLHWKLGQQRGVFYSNALKKRTHNILAKDVLLQMKFGKITNFNRI